MIVEPIVVRLDDDDVPLAIGDHALRLAFVRLRHLPAQKIFPIRRKFLHAPRHIDNVEIILRIDSNRTRLIELPYPVATATENFDTAEKLAGHLSPTLRSY